jgi:hypothetical protein
MNKFLSMPTLWLIAACVAGMIAHVFKKAMRGELGVGGTNPFKLPFYRGMYSYLLLEKPGHTAAAFLTCLAACLGIVATGQIEMLKPHIIIALGFTTGWACNSGINQGQPGGTA